MSREEWLKSVKAGDMVIEATHYGHYTTAVVTRVTPSGIIIIGNTKYRNGIEMTPDRFSACTLVEPTKKLMSSLKLIESLHRLKQFFCSDSAKVLTLEDTEAIHKIIEHRNEICKK